jgi:hypothetical protein
LVSLCLLLDELDGRAYGDLFDAAERGQASACSQVEFRPSHPVALLSLFFLV